jgi:hypothetical protein
MKHGEPSTRRYRGPWEQLGDQHAVAGGVVTPAVIGAHEAASLVNFPERQGSAPVRAAVHRSARTWPVTPDDDA